MALHFKTSNPKRLLDTFKKRIDEGVVSSWVYDADGDFTHTREVWKNQAWLRPVVKDDELSLKIIKREDKDITAKIYSVYHGRFIEDMLLHCDNFFSNVSASALPETGEKVSS